MTSLKAELDVVKLPAHNRERLIEFRRMRARQGPGPGTLTIDLSFFRTIMARAAAVHDDHRSIRAAFTRACDKLKIEDLHFHDPHHERTSRLFEARPPIEKVALVTGHEDWRRLQRYTNPKS